VLDEVRQISSHPKFPSFVSIPPACGVRRYLSSEEEFLLPLLQTNTLG
jgi:hypothetical protein